MTMMVIAVDQDPRRWCMDPASEYIIGMTSNAICTNWNKISFMLFASSALRHSKFKQTYQYGYIMVQCSHTFKIFDVYFKVK